MSGFIVWLFFWKERSKSFLTTNGRISGLIKCIMFLEASSLYVIQLHRNFLGKMQISEKSHACNVLAQFYFQIRSNKLFKLLFINNKTANLILLLINLTFLSVLPLTQLFECIFKIVVPFGLLPFHAFAHCWYTVS